MAGAGVNPGPTVTVWMGEENVKADGSNLSWNTLWRILFDVQILNVYFLYLFLTFILMMFISRPLGRF